MRGYSGGFPTFLDNCPEEDDFLISVCPPPLNEALMIFREPTKGLAESQKATEIRHDSAMISLSNSPA